MNTAVQRCSGEVKQTHIFQSNSYIFQAYPTGDLRFHSSHVLFHLYRNHPSIFAILVVLDILAKITHS